jgi:hypothetical protein
VQAPQQRHVTGPVPFFGFAANLSARLGVLSPLFRQRLVALSFSEWFGLFAPKGMPKDIVGRLNAAAVEALADPAVRSRFIDIGLEVFPRDKQTPEALGALQKADAGKWWMIIKEFGIKAVLP